MHPVFFGALASAVFSSVVVAAPVETTSPSSASAVPSNDPMPDRGKKRQSYEAWGNRHDDKSSEELAAICEKEMQAIKELIPSDLNAISRAEADYHLSATDLEIKALKDKNHGHTRKHVASCRYHIKAVKKIIDKHQHLTEKHQTIVDRQENEELAGSAASCEKEMETVKGNIPSDLSPIAQAEIKYNLSAIGLEIEALKDKTQGYARKHVASCRHHLKAIRKIVDRHQHLIKKEKKAEERKRKEEERKARREEKKAERTRLQEERDPSGRKQEQDSKNRVEKDSGFIRDLDHGKTGGEDKTEPGTDVGVTSADADTSDSMEKK